MSDYDSDYYDPEDVVESDDDVEEEDQYEEPEDNDNNINKPVSAISLNEDELFNSMNDVIQSVSSTLSLPLDTCSILLRNFYWDVDKLQDSWFSDQSKTCDSAGVFVPMKQQGVEVIGGKKSKRRYKCIICFDRFHLGNLDSTVCGHLFCKECWKQYISIAISEGAKCLTLRCPDLDCSVSIDEGLINRLIGEDDKKKYKRLLVSSFVECSKGIKWCPAPGCVYAVGFVGGEGFKDQEEVMCKCSYEFCWDCVGERHRPVDCETAVKWHEKNNSDTLNTEWKLVNSKPCPKCKNSIEKNQGCNHMTCRPPCNYHFCWTCMGSWELHGYSPCNFLPKQVENYLEAEKKLAKNNLQKYIHYYERWMNNHMSEQKAIESLNNFKVKVMKELSDLYNLTDAQMEDSFIFAWKQIVECRRVLRWTYAYGYYLPDVPDEKKPTLFEDLQGQAEAALERLHHWVEKEVENYLKLDKCGVIETKDRSKEFFTYKAKVLDLTNITRKFFNNLVQGLETGLI